MDQSSRPPAAGPAVTIPPQLSRGRQAVLDAFADAISNDIVNTMGVTISSGSTLEGAAETVTTWWSSWLNEAIQVGVARYELSTYVAPLPPAEPSACTGTGAT